MFSAALSIAGKGRHIHNHVRVTMAIHKARWRKRIWHTWQSQLENKHYQYMYSVPIKTAFSVSIYALGHCLLSSRHCARVRRVIDREKQF